MFDKVLFLLLRHNKNLSMASSVDLSKYKNYFSNVIILFSNSVDIWKEQTNFN